MDLDFPTIIIEEGKARIRVPKISRNNKEPLDHAISEAPVFYNPLMQLNRDTAVLILSEYQKRIKGKYKTEIFKYTFHPSPVR